MKNTTNKSYYVWDFEAINAQITSFSHDGKTLYCNIGSVPIEQGDIVTLDYGSSLGVLTSTGKAYENQYPFGKISLYGIGAGVVLNGSNSIYLKKETSSIEEFNNKVIKQVNRTQPLINNLYVQYQEQQKIILKEQQEHKANNDAVNKLKVASALEKMNAVFGKTKKKF